jgi:hypothetical protein
MYYSNVVKQILVTRHLFHVSQMLLLTGMLRAADWYLPTFRDNLSVPSSRVK